MRATLAAGLALVLPLAASAQFAEPEVQVQRLSGKDYPAVAEDEPAIMSAEEFYRSRTKAFSVEEVAVVRVAFNGRWYRSADYLAREKAASLGANALMLVESIGREDLGAGALRRYRVFRLTDSLGRPVYTKPAPEAPRAGPTKAAAGPAEEPKPASGEASAPPAPRREHSHFEWVWTRDAAVVSHRLGFDAARASQDEREQLMLYVRENFPAAEYGNLVKALAARSKVVLDFVNGKVE